MAQNRKAQLTKADGKAVNQQQAKGNFGPGNEQQRREGHQQEAQPRQHQWRHVVQPHFDDHKIESPHHDKPATLTAPSFPRHFPASEVIKIFVNTIKVTEK
ncbi:hypothetical protein MJK72_14195 [Klebsiella pneumoniae]|nr:hypothetical protein MJK72_14195 [Klebsiella pneumoniae]